MAHRQFTLRQRQTIEQMLHEQASQSAIARALGVSRSSVCRELQRNTEEGKSYEAESAHLSAKGRKQLAAMCGPGKVIGPKFFHPNTKISHTVLFSLPGLGSCRLRMDMRLRRVRDSFYDFKRRTKLFRPTGLRFRDHFWESIMADDKTVHRFFERKEPLLVLNKRKRIRKLKDKRRWRIKDRLSLPYQMVNWENLLFLNGRKLRFETPIVPFHRLKELLTKKFAFMFWSPEWPEGKAVSRTLPHEEEVPPDRQEAA